MLHTEVVSGKTLELLKKLEAENAMTRFNLAGGTSLALYLGHRRSVDLDLFTPKPFDAAELERWIPYRLYGEEHLERFHRRNKD